MPKELDQVREKAIEDSEQSEVSGRAIRSSPLLAFASYSVVKAYEDSRNESPTSLYFNKLLSLSHRALKSKGVDIQLPHCWYLFGDEVVRYWMPRGIQWEREEQSPTRISWAGEPPRNSIPQNVRSEILSVVGKHTETYVTPGGLGRLLERVYAYAPFDFQRDFRKFRRQLSPFARSRVTVKNYVKRRVLPQLRKSLSEFPSYEFPEVGERIPRFGKVLVSLLEGEPDLEQVRLSMEMSRKLWELFCYFLRVHPEARENVPEEALRIWRDQLDPSLETYDRVFVGHAMLAAELMPAMLQDAELAALMADYEASLGTASVLLEEFADILPGLKDFEDEVRKGYRYNSSHKAA